MCTALVVRSKNILFGRNMDIDYSFNEQVIFLPKNHLIRFKEEINIKSEYAILGTGTIIDEYPMFADAMNEKGLAFAGLAFEDCCEYYKYKTNMKNLAPYEFVLYLLSLFSTVNEIKEELLKINIINIPINEETKLANLHFIFTDKKESIVVETTSEGMKIYENKYDILTNNPPFSYHCYNITNYMQLHNNKPYNNIANTLVLKPYSFNQGAIGLPGDYSSASRFIKCFYLKSNLVLEGIDKDYNEFFKCLDSVAMIKGAVKTNKGYEITRYTNCYDLEKSVLLYKTYDDPAFKKIKMNLSKNDCFCIKIQ